MKKGPLSILLCYLFWGVLPIFWKSLNGLSSIYALSSRIVWSFVFCGIIIVLTGGASELKRVFKNKTEMKFLVYASIAVTLNWGLYIFAVVTNHIVEASLAYFLFPIISFILGFFLFHEKITKVKGIAIAIAFIGVMIPIFVYGKIPVLALMIALSFSIYGAAKKKVSCSGMVSVFVETLIMTPLALIAIGYFESKGIGALSNLSGLSLVLVPMTGVVTAIPQVLFARGMRTTPMATAGILMYINPMMQLMIGALVYKEPLTKINIISFIFIWVAIIIYMSSTIRSERVKI